MILEQIVSHRYRVPFRVPFTTSQGLAQHREGALLRVATRDGWVGYGEVAPLPSFGTARLDVLESKVREIEGRVSGTDINETRPLIDQLAGDPTLAPVRFALDTALLDIQSRAAGLSLCRYLNPNAASAVPLNATISDMDERGAASAAYYAVMAGYGAVKVKAGAGRGTEYEVKRVAAIREAIGPDTELRLDVNGGWTVEQATEIAGKLCDYNISYIEQPVPPSDIAAMARLRAQISIPIAADEAASTRGAVEEIIRLKAADAIVIKAAIVGGVSVARELIALARDAGMRVVVTTALETGVGITAALHLAATLPEPIPPCGLATGALMETDLLVHSPRIEAGHMIIPSGDGLGVEPLGSVFGRQD